MPIWMRSSASSYPAPIADARAPPPRANATDARASRADAPPDSPTHPRPMRARGPSTGPRRIPPTPRDLRRWTRVLAVHLHAAERSVVDDAPSDETSSILRRTHERNDRGRWRVVPRESRIVRLESRRTRTGNKRLLKFKATIRVFPPLGLKNPVAAMLDRHPVNQDARSLGPKRPKRIPDPCVPQDQRPRAACSNFPVSLSEIQSIKLRMRFVVLESNERQLSNIDVFATPVRRKSTTRFKLSSCGRFRFKSKSVPIAFHGDIPRERIQAIRPPKPRPGIVVERECLIRQRLARERLHSQVAVEQVQRLRPILKKEAVTDRR